MPDGQNQGPDLTGGESAAGSPVRQPNLASFDAAPAAPGGGDPLAGLFAPDAGFADMHDVGRGQTMPIVGEPWP